MTANRNPIEVQTESGEARNIEQQALDDASLEPAAVVERGKDYQSAEAIQADLTAAVDGTESTGAAPQATSQPARGAGATPQAISQSARKVDAAVKVSTPSGNAEIPALSDEKPADEAAIVKSVDPKTGQSKTTGTGHKKTPVAEDGPEVEEKSLVRDGRASNRELDSGKTPAGVSDAEKAIPDGVLKYLPDHKGRTRGKSARDGIHVESSKEAADQAGISHLEKQLPQALIDAVGMGRNGLIDKGGGKSTIGGKGGKPVTHTPKGGLPVSGGGSKGDGTDDKIHSMLYGTKVHSMNSESGRFLTQKAIDSGNDFVLEPDGKGVWELHGDGYWYYHLLDDEEAPAEKKPQGDPIDPDFGIPFTGSYGSTGDADPFPNGPDQGPDREAGFLRMISKVGMDYEWEGLIGLGSTGSKTFSPDGSSDDDDSGHSYGGLFGGGNIESPNNPDDPDYYTPNIMKDKKS